MKIKMKNYARHLWLSLLLLVGATAIAVPGLNGTNSGGVAKIGSTEYATLEAAVDAAEDRAIIQVVKAGEYAIPAITKNLTIEATVEGVAVTHEANSAITTIASDKTATFKKITFNLGTLKLPTAHGFGTLSGSNGALVMDGCTINGALNLFGKSTFTNCQFNAEGIYNIWAVNDNATFTGCTFTNTNRAVNVYDQKKSSTTKNVSFSNCTFNGSAKKKAAVNIHHNADPVGTAAKYAVSITNCTTSGTWASTVEETGEPDGSTICYSPLWMISDIVNWEDGDITVTVGGVAQDVSKFSPVAKIGETKYTSLQAAVDAAEAGATIDILKDFTLTTVTTSPSDKYNVNVNKSVTINGNGHVLTSAEGKRAIVLQGAGNNVVLKDITVKSNKAEACLWIADAVNVTLDNSTLDGTKGKTYNQPLTIGQFNSESRVILNVINRSVIKTNDAGTAHYDIIAWHPADITVTNSKLIGWAGVYLKPGAAGSTVKIDGSEMKSTGIKGNSNNFAAIVTESGNNEIEVKDTKISTTPAENTNQSLFMLGGEGNVVKFLGSSTYETTDMTYGPVTHEPGSLVNNKVYFDDATKAAFAKYFTAGDGPVIADEKDAEVGLYPVTYTPEVYYYWFANGIEDGGYYDLAQPFIKGWLDNGEFIRLNKDIELTANLTWAKENASFTMTFGDYKVTKGEFSIALKQGVTVNTDKPTDIFSAVDAGYKVVETAVEGGYTYTVVAKEYVAQIGEEQKYYSLAEAFEAATDGQTITVLTDIDLPSTIAVTKQVTLDLDGKKIFNTSDLWAGGNWSFFSVQANGNLTVTGDGTIDAKENDCYAFDVRNGGILTIKNGTFKGNISCVYLINEAEKGVSTCNIEGGTFSIKQLDGTSGYNFLLNCRDASYKNNTAKFNVTGGSFENFNPANNLAEGAETDFCAAGYEAVQDGDVWTVQKAPAAKIGETTYTTLADAFTAATDGQTITVLTDIDLPSTIAVTKQVTLDLDGKKIFNTSDLWGGGNWSFFSVQAGGNLTVTGDGTIDAKENDCYAFDVRNGGILTIKNGTFTGNISCVYLINEAEKGVSTCNIEGGTFSIKQLDGTSGYNFLLNCRDASYKNNMAKFNVTGGSFVNFNPANNLAEGAETNFCAAGYEAVQNGDVWTVQKAAVAKIGETKYYSLADAFEAAQAGQTITVLTDIDLPSTIAVTKQVTLDLAGKTISNTSDLWAGGNWSFFSVQATGNLTVTGDGTIDAKENDCFTFDVRDGGILTIKDGTYTGNISSVYLINEAGTGVSTCNIEGGTFSIKQLEETGDRYRFLLNCHDASYKNNTAKFNVTGGSFVNFNPANNLAEGAETNFCAAGYEAVQNDNVWTVQKAPVAQIGETVYYSLADAVEAAGTEATTIKMLANASSDQITIPADKNIVIDFAGYTVTPTGKWLIINNGALTLSNTAEGAGGITSTFKGLVDNYGTLTVNSGTYSTTAEIAFWNNDENSTITVNGGSVSSSANVIIAENGSAVNVAGGTITATGEESYGIYSTSSKVNVSGGKVTAATEAIHLQTSSTATISGDAIVEVTGEETWGVVILSNSTLTVKDNAKITSNGFAISGNGSEGQGGTTVNIEGGTVTGGSAGIYQPQSGKLNITGGTISGETGVYVKSGELSVTGGAINGTGAKADYNFNGNGANPTGDALVIDNCSYPGGTPTASITGGYFKSDNGDPIGSYATTGNTAISNFVSGGFFNSEVSEDLCSDGFVCTDNDDTTYMFAVKTKEDAGIFELKDWEVYPYLSYTEDKEAASVTYIRRFGNTNWQALYIPFDINDISELTDKYEFAKIHMVALENDGQWTTGDKIEVYYTKMTEGKIHANKPYLIRAKNSGEQSIVVENTILHDTHNVNPMQTETTAAVYAFTGTYEGVKATSSNTFFAMGGGTINFCDNAQLGAYRWYLNFEPKTDDYAKPVVDFIESDSDATGVSSVKTGDDSDIEGYYNINGVRSETLVRGINIIRYKNGSTRKVVIK